MEIAMKVIDVRFRDPVQVGGITASARVSWRREDGPCSVSDGYVTCGDTLVPLTNVAWLRMEPFVAPASEVNTPAVVVGDSVPANREASPTGITPAPRGYEPPKTRKR